MRTYIIRRLLLIIPTVFLVTIFVFSMIRVIPGDVVELMLEEHAYAKDLAELRHKLGLDRPIYIQYIDWLGQMARGNFGVSLWTKQPAITEIAHRFPVTFELSLIAIIISLGVAIPIGILSAVRQDTKADYIARTIAIGAIAIPGFWLATLIIVLPSVYFQWSPNVEFVPFPADPIANLSQFILPAICLGLVRMGVVLRMTRAMMLEVLRQDYIRTAWSKGLRERVVIVRHGLKNALIPVISLIGVQMPFYFGGTIIMEQIFGLPGMGRFVLEVIQQRDYPMLQMVNLFLAVLIIFTNFTVDIIYGWADPRIQLR